MLNPAQTLFGFQPLPTILTRCPLAHCACARFKIGCLIKVRRKLFVRIEAARCGFVSGGLLLHLVGMHIVEKNEANRRLPTWHAILSNAVGMWLLRRRKKHQRALTM
jgi:hypothetical protein